MTTRTSKETVTFKNPFFIGGLDEIQPAGDYEVETDEELIPGVSFVAWRRILTLIRLHPKPGDSGTTRTLTIEPDELASAILLDDI
jgi:hypothetical protein